MAGQHAAHGHRDHADDAKAREKFIIDLYPAAVAVSKQTGISWQLILAQAAQETGWGQKVLPGTDNIFNIKAIGGWKGTSKTFKVPEYDRKTQKWVRVDQAFRVYPSCEASLKDWVAFLRANPRYTAAGLFKKGTKGNLGKEAAALQAAHYATDPAYARHIVRLLDGPTMQRAIREAQANMQSKSAGSAAPAPSSSPRVTH